MKQPVQTKTRWARLGSGILAAAIVSCGVLVPAAGARAQGTEGEMLDVHAALSDPELLKHFSVIETSKVTATSGSIVQRETNASTSEPLTGAVAFLENTSDEAQTMTSQVVQFSDTNAITHTVAKGLKLGYQFSIAGKANFIFAEAGITNSLASEFTVGFSKGETTSKTTTYTLPSQNVKVPARSRVKVTAVLNKARLSGTLETHADLEGDVVLRRSVGTEVSVPIGKLFAMTRADGSRLAPSNIVPRGDSAHFVGECAFSGIVGTSMTVKIESYPLSSPVDSSGPNRLSASGSVGPSDSSTLLESTDIPLSQVMAATVEPEAAIVFDPPGPPLSELRDRAPLAMPEHEVD
jgi:hypothetical protein